LNPNKWYQSSGWQGTWIAIRNVPIDKVVVLVEAIAHCTKQRCPLSDGSMRSMKKMKSRAFAKPWEYFLEI